MRKKLSFEDNQYAISDFTAKGQEIIKHLAFVHSSLETLEAQKATLNRARNGYIQDIKEEVIEKKSGVDLVGLFLEEE